jgi:hypothetical protein
MPEEAVVKFHPSHKVILLLLAAGFAFALVSWAEGGAFYPGAPDPGACASEGDSPSSLAVDVTIRNLLRSSRRAGIRTCSLAEAPPEIIDGDRGVNYPKQEEFPRVGHCLFLNAKRPWRSPGS